MFLLLTAVEVFIIALLLYKLIMFYTREEELVYRYEFTYSFMKPEVHVFKVVIDAYNEADAYYEALYEIARHITLYKRDFEAPSEATITCVKKGKAYGI